MKKSKIISGKKILITGGGGFIGSWLVARFAEKNAITVFDNGRRNALQFLPATTRKKISYISADILDYKKVEKQVKKADIILHLAAIAGVSSYGEDPLRTLKVNLFGTENILKSTVGSKVEQIVTFSTSEVYGRKAENVKETDETKLGSVYESRWSYAASKIASDHLAFGYIKKEKLPITIVRPFNIYGPRQVGEGAISAMFTSAMAAKVIEITGDGQQKRAWCYVSDFVDAIELLLAKKITGECFNIGNPDEYVTVKKLASYIKRLVPEASTVYLAKRSEEVISRRPDIEKIRKMTGFSPSVSLTEGLKATHAWYLETKKV